MGFHNVRLPDEIDYGTTGGPSFRTHVIRLDSGAEQRVGRWSDAQRSFDLKKTVPEGTQMATLHAFFLARRGKLHTFRHWDKTDFTTASDDRGEPTPFDQDLGVGDGTTKVFQLVKRYTSGPTTIPRNITLPWEGTVRVAVGGVEKTEGVDFTVDATTGRVTFMAAPSALADITWGGKYDIVGRFDTDEWPAELATFGKRELRSLPVVEVPDEGADSEDFLFRGSSVFAPMTADISISLATGASIEVECNVVGGKIFLPPLKDVPPGYPHFSITNTGSETVLVRDIDDTATVASIPGGVNTAVIFVSRTSSQAKAWRAQS